MRIQRHAHAVVILLTRPFSGKLADRIGYRLVFAPCLVFITGTAAVLSAIALPYFLLVDRKLQAATRFAIFAAACASRLLLW